MNDEWRSEGYRQTMIRKLEDAMRVSLIWYSFHMVDFTKKIDSG